MPSRQSRQLAGLFVLAADQGLEEPARLMRRPQRRGEQRWFCGNGQRSRRCNLDDLDGCLLDIALIGRVLLRIDIGGIPNVAQTRPQGAGGGGSASSSGSGAISARSMIVTEASVTRSPQKSGSRLSIVSSAARMRRPSSSALPKAKGGASGGSGSGGGCVTTGARSFGWRTG